MKLDENQKRAVEEWQALVASECVDLAAEHESVADTIERRTRAMRVAVPDKLIATHRAAAALLRAFSSPAPSIHQGARVTERCGTCDGVGMKPCPTHGDACFGGACGRRKTEPCPACNGSGKGAGGER